MKKKNERNIIYQKYNGHCAYCGKEITIKEMQVDHYYPKRMSFKGVEDISNKMPSCRRCNHYKRAEQPEGFRTLLITLHERLMKIYIFKVAVDFGIVKIQPFDGKFYYEKQKL